MKYFKNPETNSVFAYEADGSQDHIIDERLVAITPEEAAELSAQEGRAKFDARSYADKRAFAYPSMGDQLDALWKGGDAAAVNLSQAGEVHEELFGAGVELLAKLVDQSVVAIANGGAPGEREKELYRELAKASSFNPRGHLS